MENTNKFLDGKGLEYFHKRTKVQSNDNTIIVENAPNETYDEVNTINNIRLNIDEIIDKATIINESTILKTGLTLKKLDNYSDSNVKEAYQLYDSKGGTHGDVIKVYYDTSVDKVYIGHTTDTLIINADGSYTINYDASGNDAVCFIYRTVNGSFSLIPVDIAEYLKEAEFKDGLQVDEGKVSVKLSNGLSFDERSAQSGQNKGITITLNPKYGNSIFSSATSLLDLTKGGLSVDINEIQQTIVADTADTYAKIEITTDPNTDKLVRQDTVAAPFRKIGVKLTTTDDIESTTPGLVSSKTIKDYIQSGKGKLIVKKGTDGKYFTTVLSESTDDEGHRTYTISGGLNIISISDATETNNGLATSYDVQQYIENQIIALTNAEIDTINFGNTL